MPKQDRSHVGSQVPPARPAASRRSALVGGALILLVGAAAIAVVAFGPLERGERAAGEAELVERREAREEEEAPPVKPPRPVFELDNPTPSQRRVAELREQSFEVAERLVDAYPQCPEALHLLGNVHQRHRNEAGAVQLWQMCLLLDPEFADAYYSLGRLALTRGDYERAETHLRRALELDPASATAPLRLAETLMPLGRFAEAAAVLETFVSHHPASAEGWVRLGQAYQQSGDAENAKRCHLEAIALDPGQKDAHFGAGTALQALGETEEAAKYLEEFRRMRSEEPHVSHDFTPERGDELRMEITLTNTYMMAGEVYARQGDVAGTEKNWQAAAEFDPEHRESRFRLMELYNHVGRYGEAMRYCRELCELDPENPALWTNLGVVGIRSRRFDEAEAALRRAIELAPQHAEGYALLAQILMLPDRDPQEAVALARTAVELEPTAGHHYILGTARWHAGDAAAARADLARAVELEPGNREYQEAYAHVRSEP